MTPNPKTEQFVDEPSAFTGGPALPPTPEELAEFELAMREANARFMAAALAEDGMPISAGWRGPDVQPKSAATTNHTTTPNLDGVANAPG